MLKNLKVWSRKTENVQKKNTNLERRKEEELEGVNFRLSLLQTIIQYGCWSRPCRYRFLERLSPSFNIFGFNHFFGGSFHPSIYIIDSHRSRNPLQSCKPSLQSAWRQLRKELWNFFQSSTSTLLVFKRFALDSQSVPSTKMHSRLGCELFFWGDCTVVVPI